MAAPLVVCAVSGWDWDPDPGKPAFPGSSAFGCSLAFMKSLREYGVTKWPGEGRSLASDSGRLVFTQAKLFDPIQGITRGTC